MLLNKEDLENKIKNLEENIITLMNKYKQNNIISFPDNNSVLVEEIFLQVILKKNGKK